MVNFSGRYHELHGVRVRTDTPREFHGRPEKVRLHQGLSGPLLYYYTPCRFEVTPLHFRWGFFLFHRRDAPVLRVSKGGGVKADWLRSLFPRHMTKNDYS